MNTIPAQGAPNSIIRKLQHNPQVAMKLMDAACGAIELLQRWSRKDPAEVHVLNDLIAATDEFTNVTSNGGT